LDIFWGCDEVPTYPSATEKKAAPTAAAKPTVASPTSRPRIETIIPATRKATAPVLTEQDLDFTGLDERIDDGIAVDLETVDPNDSIETKLAKRMFLRMIWDLKPRPASTQVQDLFGQAATMCQGEQDRLDALVWMYSLNPDPGLVPFEWVCDVLGFDIHMVRRIVGRSMRTELKQLVNLLSTIVGADHARLCAETLSDYVDVSTWKRN
jgi:hypothetical protein